MSKERALEYMLLELRKRKFTHNFASNYYGKLNFRLVMPSILITGLSSFASFCSTSDSIPEDTKTWFLLSIGFMTTCSSILQSITGSCGFDLKKEKFKKAAVDYDFLINKIQFEINNPNEEDFLETMEEKIEKIKQECSLLPPTWIIDKWEEKDVEKSAIPSESSQLLVSNA